MFKINFKKLLIILIFGLLICLCSNINNNSFSKDNMEIHFINVTQGDAILVHVNNKTLLIDCGPKEAAGSIIHYLNKYNVNTINYLIATHPHEDHIGNMASIIKKYNVLSFYSPKVQNTGKTYENMITALKDKNLKINILKTGTNSINLGKDTSVTVLSPKEGGPNDKSNLNNYSAVLLIKYKDTSFLLTGDAEKEVEKYILSKNYKIKADVLKLGHHGSDSSTSEAFLKAVSPSLAVISVGKDNPYGHPHESTLKLLSKYNIKTLRTDKNDNIKIISDGYTIKNSKR